MFTVRSIHTSHLSSLDCAQLVPSMEVFQAIQPTCTMYNDDAMFVSVGGSSPHLVPCWMPDDLAWVKVPSESLQSCGAIAKS